MKLKRLKIKKLHNIFDYEINFFKNINVWFGKNGCGKTTLLNIINYIISGKIYKLIQYEFRLIELDYINDKNTNEKILIYYNNENNLVLNYNNEEILIEKQKLNEENDYERFNERYNEQDRYMKKYEVLEHIKNMFNIVYLPLSREMQNFENEKLIRRMRLLKRNRSNISYLDIALENVYNMIADTFAKANDEISSLEYNLKSEIFEIMFKDNKYNKEKDEEHEFSEEEKNFIINNLKKFNLYNSNLEKEIESYFKRYNRVYKKYSNALKNYDKNKDTGNIDDKFKLLNDVFISRNELISYNIINKQVEGLRLKFEEYNKRINKIMSPIIQFEDITNSFLKNSAIPKKIHVAYRNIYFTMEEKDENFDVSELSSGEKQIITMIAYFIFKVLPEEQPIFIVDEPEMSLHLMWQKSWISSIERLNPNIQLIVATHSPEIVGNYRENMINIIPKIEE